MHLKEIKGIEKLIFIEYYPGYPYKNSYIYTIKEKYIPEHDRHHGNMIEIWFDDDTESIKFYMNRFSCFGELYYVLNDDGKEDVRKNIELIAEIGLI